MTAVTNFNAINSKETPVAADAYGNNVAFQCIQCSGPVLATMMSNQRGTSPEKPAVCRLCAANYWIQINSEKAQLLVHQLISDTPRRLQLAKEPTLIAGQNLKSWSVISAILNAYGTADYDDLATAVRQHDHVAGGKAFVDYCIRNSWLAQA